MTVDIRIGIVFLKSICPVARFAAPPQMVASFNKNSQPVKTNDRVPEWTPGGAEFMVGDQVRHVIAHLSAQVPARSS